MQENSELFIGLDVSKNSHAVAVAESGRDGEVRSYGEIGADAASVRRFVRKLDRPNARLRFCYEAGPTGYGLKRQIEALGHATSLTCLEGFACLADPSLSADRDSGGNRSNSSGHRLYRECVPALGRACLGRA